MRIYPDNQAWQCFEHVRASVPEVVSSEGSTQETFRVNQLAEGVERTPEIDAAIDAAVASFPWATPEEYQRIASEVHAANVAEIRALLDYTDVKDAEWRYLNLRDRIEALHITMRGVREICRRILANE
jgi:hypothetical protein